MRKIGLVLLLCLFPLTAFADGNDANTNLLLHCNGTDESTDFPDVSSYEHACTATGNAQVDTAQQKFGTGSLLCNGLGDYIDVADNACWDIGTGDFTIDFWVKVVDNTLCASFVDIGGYMAGIDIYYHQYGHIQWWVKGADGYSTQGLINNDTWYHIAFVRSSGTVTIYLNGTAIAAGTTMSGSVTGISSVHIGDDIDNASRYLKGWMDEIRISNVARWTEDFDVPTEEYSAAVTATTHAIINIF